MYGQTFAVQEVGSNKAGDCEYVDAEDFNMWDYTPPVGLEAVDVPTMEEHAVYFPDPSSEAVPDEREMSIPGGLTFSAIETSMMRDDGGWCTGCKFSRPECAFTKAQLQRACASRPWQAYCRGCMRVRQGH